MGLKKRLLNGGLGNRSADGLERVNLSPTIGDIGMNKTKGSSGCPEYAFHCIYQEIGIGIEHESNGSHNVGNGKGCTESVRYVSSRPEE